MRSILLFQNLKDKHLDKIKKVVPHDWEIIDGTIEGWQDRLDDVEICAGWWGADPKLILERAPKLNWIQTWGAGVDGLPLQELIERNIIVTNASGVHANPISENIFGMLLSFSRNMHIYARQQAHAYWKRKSPSFELHGLTIGIIGVGAIGEETAKIAQAFGMRVLGVRRSGKAVKHVDKMYALKKLDHVLEESDIVVVTLPQTTATQHLFGPGEFQRMKSSAIFINIGRGATVDTEALVQALQTGEISYAGLDVFETEPLPADHPLWSMDNVIITPHVSGDTPMYNARMVEIFTENLKTFMKNRSPHRNVVDLQEEY